MAARKRTTSLDKEWRSKIQASLIITRLNQHAQSDEEIMTPSQIKAAEILLRKVLPDLKQVEHKGEDGTTLVPAFVMIAPKGKK